MTLLSAFVVFFVIFIPRECAYNVISTVSLKENRNHFKNCKFSLIWNILKKARCKKKHHDLSDFGYYVAVGLFIYYLFIYLFFFFFIYLFFFFFFFFLLTL